MKKKYLLIALLVLLLSSGLRLNNVWAQNSLNCTGLNPDDYSLCDDFSDGDFSDNPVWTTDYSDWEILDQQLHSNANPDTGSAYISTPSNAMNDVQWTFYVRMDFNPSSSNYADFYLTSDNEILKGEKNGYFVRIGNTKDQVSLYREDMGSKEEIISGTEDVTDVSMVETLVKVSRNSSGEWTLEHDAGLTGSFTSEGTVTDNTYTTSQYSGIFIKYTSTRADKFYFDDVYIGKEITDDVPPEITGLTVINNKTVEVHFSELLNPTTASNTDNYTITNNGKNPVQANVNGNDVELIFDFIFMSGQTYDLNIKNLTDLAGNLMQETTKPFSYFEAQSGDVIINEIYTDNNSNDSANPPDILMVDDFVELYNRSNNEISLNNWGLTDDYPNVVAEFSNISIGAGEYIVLCKTVNVDFFEALSNETRVIGMDDFPALNNTGETITLMDNKGSAISVVSDYGTNWYGDTEKAKGGWSLERINPDNLCDDAGNWLASEHKEWGSTPGMENSVMGMITDTDAPKIISIEIIDAQKIKLYFDETLDLNTAAEKNNYSIDNGIEISNLNEDNKSVELVLNNALVQGTVYTITVNGLKDCTGNTTDNVQAFFAIPEGAAVFDVLINEIYADITIPENFENPNLTLPDAEYIELYNRSGKVISLKDWQFMDSADTTVMGNYLLLSNAYVIVCDEDDAHLFLEKDRPVLGIPSFPNLNDTEDNLTITDAAGNVIHFVNYSKKWYQHEIRQEGGYSLEMIDPSNPCEGKNNWRASENLSGGTPGIENSIKGVQADNTSPNLLRAEALDEFTVELYFDEALDETTAQSLSLYQIDNSIGSPAAISMMDNFRTLVLNLSGPLQNNIVYTITVDRNVTDCAGNVLEVNNTEQFGLAETPEAGDVLISEILFNPVSGGKDFVELYNATNNKILNLVGWFIANADVEANPDSLTNYTPIATVKQYTLLPGEWLVLTEDAAQVIAHYGECGDVPAGAFIELDLPSLDDKEGVVALTDIKGSLLDKVHYSSDWHSAILDDQNGASLERISYTAPSQEPSNWQTAAQSHCFATPGYQNSQYYENIVEGPSTIIIDPKVFSPDSDGFQDFLNIAYQLDGAGYTMNITIFDDRGREVQHLVKNEILSPNGTVKWDGSTAEGNKAGIGIYILLIEVFDQNGNVETFKETCVVGGKL